MAIFKEDRDAILNDIRNKDEATIRELKEDGLLDLDNGAWNGIYYILGYNPPCPTCGAQMRYNWGLGMLQCPSCGLYIWDGDYDYSEMPEKEDIDFDNFYTN